MCNCWLLFFLKLCINKGNILIFRAAFACRAVLKWVPWVKSWTPDTCTGCFRRGGAPAGVHVSGKVLQLFRGWFILGLYESLFVSTLLTWDQFASADPSGREITLLALSGGAIPGSSLPITSVLHVYCVLSPSHGYEEVFFYLWSPNLTQGWSLN